MNETRQSKPEPLLARLSTRESLIVAVACLLFVTLVTFSRVPLLDFVTWDDNIHVYDNPYFRPFDFNEFLHFWAHAYKGLYVPLSYTAFGLLTLVAKLPPGSTISPMTGSSFDPRLFHTTSLLLHSANLILVYLLLRRLVNEDLPALLGALVFAVHPLQVESVAWVSELRGLLGALFTLISLHLYLNSVTSWARERKVGGNAEFAASLLTAICAMLSKPSSVIIALLIVLLGVFMCRKTVKTATLEALPFGIAGMAFVVVTAHIQSLPPGEVTALWQRPFIAGDALAFYLWKFVAPIDLAIDYGRTPAMVLSKHWAYIDWTAPAVIAALTIARWKKSPCIVLGVAFSLIALLPVLGLTPFVFQKISTTADRYVYLAMAGAGIVISATYAAVPASKRLAAGALIGMWIVVLCVLSYRQVDVWQNSETLFVNAVAVNPRSAVSQNNLGTVFKNQGLEQAALQHYEMANQLDPSAPLYRDNVGVLESQLGDLRDAESMFRDVIAESPENVDAHNDLGRLLIDENRDSEGVAELSTALKLDPAYYIAAEDLGDYFANKGDFKDAAAIFANGLRYRPDIEPLWRNLGAALDNENQQSEAINALETATRMDPSDQSARGLLDLIVRQRNSGP